jgi:hypothetical protein
MIPILVNHNHGNLIGCVIVGKYQIDIEFSEGITLSKDEFFNMFGDCAAEFTDIQTAKVVNKDTPLHETYRIKKAQIFYFNKYQKP